MPVKFKTRLFIWGGSHGHGHYHAQGGPDFFFATKVTQGTLFRAQYTHIKRPPNSSCVFLSALEDTTKMTAHSRATGLPDLAGDPKNAPPT